MNPPLSRTCSRSCIADVLKLSCPRTNSATASQSISPVTGSGNVSPAGADRGRLSGRTQAAALGIRLRPGGADMCSAVSSGSLCCEEGRSLISSLLPLDASVGGAITGCLFLPFFELIALAHSGHSGRLLDKETASHARALHG